MYVKISIYLLARVNIVRNLNAISGYCCSVDSIHFELEVVTGAYAVNTSAKQIHIGNSNAFAVHSSSHLYFSWTRP
jgi:hypothetical protein